MKEKKHYEEHEDLKEFEKKYNKRINEFLESNPETRIVFLNADFGWGKTTFVENNLKIPCKQIYSPWLNKSENYLEEIYYNVAKKDKGVLSSVALFISVILTMITILASSIISILTELSKDNTYTFKLEKFKIICISNDKLDILFLVLILIIGSIIAILALFIFLKPIPIVNFFGKDNGKYYENKIIKNIVKRVDKVLVIEDIDRADDIESILIAANKISKYIKDNNFNIYILITGDYVRMIRRISEPNIYDNGSLNLSTYRTKGTLIVEKIISLRIDFSSIYERINTLLTEYNLKTNLEKIEYDEIISFIKNKYLSIRFFIRFLERYSLEINKSNSLYHLMLKYYQEEKYFNVPQNVIDKSIYNIERFPNCLNDIEMMLQKDGITINDIKYTNIKINNTKENNYNIINEAFNKLLFEKNDRSVKIFKEFYTNDLYPVLEEDEKNIPNYNNTVNIGSRLKPINLKQDLDNFLLSYNNNEEEMGEVILINKRCYFPTINTSNSFEYYKINEAYIEETKKVSNEDFLYAYIATFFRKNNKEIENNYYKIREIILDILNK